MTIHNRVLNTVSLEFSSLARAMLSGNEKMLSLGLGEPGFKTPDAIIEAAYDAMKKGETRYASPWGTSELLAKIAARIKNVSGNEVKANEVIVTLGAKQALSLALTSILEAKDEVIVFTPCYVSFIPQILMAEPSAKIVEIALNKNDFSIPFSELLAKITNKTKAIVVNFPNNPTGKILEQGEMKRLVVEAQRRGIFLVSDEIYSTLLIANNDFQSFASYWPEYKNIFVIDGFSKAYSMTGWRIGYLAGPVEKIKRVSVLQQHLNTNIPVFIQRAAEKALDLPIEFHQKYNQLLSENELCLWETLKMTTKLSYVRSQGGMFAFVNISKLGIDSDSFCTQFLEKHLVAIVPGKLFGCEWDSHIRISLGGDKNEFIVAMSRLVVFVDQLVIAHQTINIA